MANPKVKFKRSSVQGKSPTAGDLPLGEVAINTYDGIIYTSKSTDGGLTTSIVNVSGIQLRDEDSPVGYANTVNFTGTGVVASVQNGVGIVTISSGDSSSIGISSSGTLIGTGVTTFNFVGSGVTISVDGTTGSINIPSTTKTTTREVATADQTTFTGLTYTVGYIDVYLNGSKLDSTEYTANNGTSVVLTTGASENDVLEFVALNGLSITDLNGLQNVVEDTTPQLGGNLDLNGKTIDGTGGINITGVVTATSFTGNLTGTATTATKIQVTSPPVDDATYPLLVSNSSSGDYQAFYDGLFKWDAINNELTVPTLVITTGIDLQDSDYIYFGTGDDVKVFYDGTADDLEIELESTANKIAITNNGTYKHLITRDGKVGINTSVTPTVELEVNGNTNIAGVVTATDFNSTSDINLKTNVQKIENPIEKIMSINGVQFNWKETNQPSIGIIAQEIEKVFPELVRESDDHKTVNYNGIIGVLIEAIKNQQEQINILKAEIKSILE